MEWHQILFLANGKFTPALFIALFAAILVGVLAYGVHYLEMSRKNSFTKLLETEEALRVVQERFELAVAGSSNGLWDWNVATGDVYFAPRFKELLGYADHEMENRFDAWRVLLHPDDTAPTLAAVEAHIVDRSPYSVRYRLRCKSGQYRWFLARGQAIWNSSGNATRMAGSILDISDQIEAEQERESSERLYLSLVEHLPVYLIRKDRQGRFTFANQAFCKLLGKSLDEIRGLTDYDFYPKELAEKYRRDDLRVMETGILFKDIEDHVDADDHRYFEVLKTQVLDATGSVAGSQCICWDVTDRRQAELELQGAKLAAEKANQAKSEFLANMSHEIRTPMNAIIGMTEMVLESQLAPDQREYLASVMEAGESLMSIINEILDFSKIEAGRLQLESARFDLREMLGVTAKSLGVRAHRKALELVWQCERDVPTYVVGDATRLRQILFNLIGNAIKFTLEGEVFLSVRKTSETENSIRLEFSVIDSGIGIAPENLKKIFDAFHQADASTTRQFGGTGLGLSISRRLVQLFGGDIEVESKLGKGSVFRFTANFGRDTSPTVERILDTSKFHETHVLVVDDNATNRKILVEVLSGWGLKVYATQSGRDAINFLELARATSVPPPVTLVITDYHMPEMDGLMLASEIRKESRLADVSIVLLSSSIGLPQAKFEKLDIAALLYKPIKQSELFDALSQVICSVKKATPIPDGQEMQPMNPLNILLAEDGLTNQKLAAGLLRRWGHTVTTADNGEDAVNQWSTGDFDVILMDVQMPGVDGLDAARMIRSKEVGTDKHVPIIALTAHAMSGDREKCEEAGMDGYVSKPFKKQSLYQALASIIYGNGRK